MSKFFADISGNKIDLDDIFTKKNNDSSNNVVTGFIYNGQDLGERYYTIPEDVSSISYKYDITGQYTFNHKDVKKDFMNIFSQQTIYEFAVISSNGSESTNNDGRGGPGFEPNINCRKGLGAKFVFKLMTDASSTFQIGKINGGDFTDVIGADLQVHQNGGKGGDGIVIYIKMPNEEIANICFIGGGGGAGGFNSDYNNTSNSYQGIDHSPYGKGGNSGTTINYSDNNFNFYYGGQGGNGLDNNGVDATRSGGSGGEEYLSGNYGNVIEKYNGENGFGGAFRFGGGGGGGGYHHGGGGFPGGTSKYPSDSASGGGAGGSKVNNSMNIDIDTIEQNNDTVDKASVIINGNSVYDSKMLNIDQTKANGINTNFNTIEYYTSTS